MLARIEGNEAADTITEKFNQLTIQETEVALDYVTDYFRAKTFTNVGRVTAKKFSLKLRGSLFLDPAVPEEFREGSAMEENLPERIIDHVGTMSSWFPSWQEIVKGKSPFDSTGIQFAPFYEERLSLLITKPLGHKLPIPLLLQASAHLAPSDFFKLVSLIERTFFRVKTVCRGNEGKLERVYQDLARTIGSTGHLDFASVQQQLQQVVEEEASDTRFEFMLGQFQYKPNLSAKMVYLFASLDILSKPQPEKAVMDVTGKGYTIEHVAPQSGGGSVSEDRLHSIGNLCLLNKHENPQFSNKSFAEKKALADNGVALSSRLSAKVFVENDKWTDEEVNARLAFLVQQAKKVFTPSLIL
jgi:hypothetical protein